MVKDDKWLVVKWINVMNKFKYIICVLLIFVSFSSYAEKVMGLDGLVNMMQHALNDKAGYQRALEQGKERITLCQYCHGKNGISIKDNVPNLAAQNAEYLIRQFEYFASNTRKDNVMSELAKNLSQSDKVNVALYFASQKASEGQYFSGGDVKKGEALFAKLCTSCHGNDGHGKQTLPRIAGQPPAYVIKTLRSYKISSLARPDSPMQAIAAKLSEDDINSLTAYISAQR